MHRRGMTLFEILLVLVLLVIVSSLSVPLFEGSFATVRLRRGSDQLLAAWSDARVQAVQTGRTYEFLFQSESSLYRVQPWQAQQVSDAVTDPTAADSTQAVLLTYEAELPEEIMFAEGDAITLTAANERTVETLNQSGESVWSAPILFFPDGSTSSASVLLRNERRLFQRITLRALTGVGRVSDVLTEDEAEQLKGR
jgi:prepilin-type N-terminal cleavage/methylation domain-containing protein